jgi:hypothetical protein
MPFPMPCNSVSTLSVLVELASLAAFFALSAFTPRSLSHPVIVLFAPAR